MSKLNPQKLTKRQDLIIEKLAIFLNSSWSLDLGINREDRFNRLAELLFYEGYRKVRAKTVNKIPKTWENIHGG